MRSYPTRSCTVDERNRTKSSASFGGDTRTPFWEHWRCCLPGGARFWSLEQVGVEGFPELEKGVRGFGQMQS